MKKTISLVLALALTAATFAFAIPAGAAEYDGFTVYCSPAEYSVQEGSDETISVSINFANNPGLWATRIFVVYPDGLSVDDGSGKADVTNPGTIYTGASDMALGIHDLSLEDSRQTESFKKIIKDQSIPTEGYRSVCLYFEPEDTKTVLYNDGVLANLNFTLTDSAKSGDVLDIKVYYGVYDFLWANTDNKGNVSFVSYYPDVYGAEVTVTDCPHLSSYDDRKEPTCTESGYEMKICTQCGEILTEAGIPTLGHDSCGEVITVPATCTAVGSKTVHCSVCGEAVSTEELPVVDHNYTDTVVEPTKTEQGYTVHTCSVCGDEYIDSYVDAVVGEIIPGDLNSDDIVSIVDMNILKRILSGSICATDIQFVAGDINGDGSVNVYDAGLLVRIVTGVAS